MSTDVGCLEDIHHALQNINQTLEGMVALKKAFVTPGPLERRRALAEGILKQMVWTTMTMRGKLEPPVEGGRKELAVAAWHFADEMMRAENPIMGSVGAVPGEHEEDNFEVNPAYDPAASTPRAPSGRNKAEADNARGA